MKIILDAVEERICKLLLSYSKEFTQMGNPSVTLRFTGGWVRDKLLGRTSHDIDVAIDKSTGEEFAVGLHEYMDKQGIAENNSVHKVALNPEKSKHLETAMMRVCGLDIDFVNLRSEEYASGSRVPTKIEFGTPAEDAFRRDATLNALFYNLTTNSVEDFTGKGLEDLKHGVLRTPLSPKETFSDDPLRVLRLLRFVGQLGFSIATETYDAMHGDEVGQNIRDKVSGERVGVEMSKLLASPNALQGVHYIVDLDLAPYIFAYRATDKKTRSATLANEDARSGYDGMKQLIATSPNLASLKADDKIILWLSTLLYSLDSESVSNIVQGGLKLTRVVKEGCVKLVNSVEQFDILRKHITDETVTRSELGLFVRKCGALWPLAVEFNAARLYSNGQQADDAVQVGELVVKYELQDAYSLKPLIAGKELMTLLQIQPGAIVAQILAAEIEYQLQNPAATKDEVADWLVSKFKPNN